MAGSLPVAADAETVKHINTLSPSVYGATEPFKGTTDTIDMRAATIAFAHRVWRCDTQPVTAATASDGSSARAGRKAAALGDLDFVNGYVKILK